MKKKILTRKEFDQLRITKANMMSKDKALFRNSIKLIEKADEHMFIHQNNFFGEPSINFSDDLMRFQELIYKTKPDYVIEIGVAWGGTTLFLANILEGIGKGKVIGVDVYIPKHVKKSILNKKKLSKRISLITGSSISENVFSQIKKITNGKKCTVILDSNHTEEHVLQELKMYSKIIKKNFHIIVCDTLINYIKPNKFRKRPWGKNNNPLTAIKKFSKLNKSFKIDDDVERKLLLSCNYKGYLKKIK